MELLTESRSSSACGAQISQYSIISAGSDFRLIVVTFLLVLLLAKFKKRLACCPLLVAIANWLIGTGSLELAHWNWLTVCLLALRC